MALEYGGRTLSRYDVSLARNAKLEAVTNPHLFASPYETGQPELPRGRRLRACFRLGPFHLRA